VDLRTESFAATDVGLVRELNEDRYFSDDEQRLWAGADGMGGMSRGDWAAERIVETLRGLRLEGDLDQAVSLLGNAIEQANSGIARQSEETGEQMGSTIVSLIVREGTFGVLWVGDSRAYL